jgi:hypothetical protein
VRRFALAICVVAAVDLTAAVSAEDMTLATVLERAGARVEQYFARAQSIMCLEVVHLQPLSSSWSSNGFGRVVESELRLSWEPAADGTLPTEAQTLRQLLKVNGRPPRTNDHNNCTTPEQETEETQPLSMLLSGERVKYAFTMAGRTTIDRRGAIMIDFRLLKAATVDARMVEGRDDCVSFNVEGGMRGRIWVDAETHDVLRLDQRLASMVEIPLPRAARRQPHAEPSWTLERWDTSIRFRPVTFANPDETLLLPESQSSVQVTRGSGSPRLRTMTNYKNYQRFVTGARVVGD